MYNFIKDLNEGRSFAKLEQVPLPYPKDKFGRSLSKQAIEYHYGKLYKGYVDRFNNREGDINFNEAGARLHAIYFGQLCPPKAQNKPEGSAEAFINQHFGTYEKFQAAFEKTAMGIQGSGWVYLADDGKIKTIVNHEIKHDIVLLIDWWEHAWALDYQSDKKKYLENHWKIINWSVIMDRLSIK